VQEGKLNALREKLLIERSKRVRPGRDDKVLADWNGLMIYGLVQASDAFNRVDWQAAAVKAFWFVADTMGTDGQLAHSWRQGKIGAPGIADDYANMARAALALYEVTGHPPYLEKAVAWAKTLNEQFWRTDIGGYALTPADGEKLIVRVRTVMDGATPSVNGTMMHVLPRLHAFTGDRTHAERFSILTQAFAEDARRQLVPAATYLNGFDFVLRSVHVVIVGNRNDAAVGQFRDVFRRISLPAKIVSVVAPGESLPSGHPAAGKGQINNLVTAYLCTGQTCSPPVTDPNQLELLLKTRMVAPGSTATQPGP
jgi:hypothetical protein